MKSISPSDISSSSHLNYLFILIPMVMMVCNAIGFLEWLHFLPRVMQFLSGIKFGDGFVLHSGIYGFILIYCYSCPSHQELVKTLFIGFLLDVILIIFGYIKLPGIGVWFASVTALGLRCFKRESTQQHEKTIATFFACLGFPLAIILSLYLLGLTTYDNQIVDPLLRAVDSTLGFHPSFLCAQLFANSPHIVQTFIREIYFYLPLAWGIAYLLRSRNNSPAPLELITEFFTAGIIGMLLYNVIPACGPKYIFSAWSWHPNVSSSLLSLKTTYFGLRPRNCMPSLHAVWALCIWRQLQVCEREIRILSTVWLLLLLFSTMALGEHYLIDLVVGVAFTTFIRGLCAFNLPFSESPRLSAICVGAALCIVWYVLILFGLPLLKASLFLSWFLFISTVIIARRFEFTLSQAQHLTNRTSC